MQSDEIYSCNDRRANSEQAIVQADLQSKVAVSTIVPHQSNAGVGGERAVTLTETGKVTSHVLPGIISRPSKPDAALTLTNSELTLLGV